jgi:hypothetical protein
MGQLEPAREEILDAFEALHSLTEFAILHSADWKEEGEMRKCCVRIIQALPEKPRPTMAEIEWDEETHYLAEAEHPYQGKVLMLGKSFFSGRICITRAKENGALWSEVKPETLTPTGRSFELTEVQE